MGEIRYLAFMTDKKIRFWIQKVRMVYIGTDWFQGEIIKHIVGVKEVAEDDGITKKTGQYHSFCFLETEEDAKKLLILAAFDTRQLHLFFRGTLDIEKLL